ncbi:MAG: 6,7-dimethyl-8-ribityllumazine synthase [Bdellovibrio sp.]|nr:6,7-dimethyl-8-ribityllumazine synthase [Bdellovibrio sp.]
MKKTKTAAKAKTPSSKSTKAAAPKAKKQAVPKQKELNIAVVTARFNDAITTKLEDGAFDFLEEFGAHILSVKVPGAIEIPLAIKALFDSKKVDGVVAIGAVIRGETSHYDYVCNSVERGCSELMLQYGKPIGFGVLTTENEAQALARAGGEHGNKGYDAAQVVVEMIGLLGEIKSI